MPLVTDIIQLINEAKLDGTITPGEQAKIDALTSDVGQQQTGATTEFTEAYMEDKLSKQTQASDIQLNPLPSLPSISNMGSVAPTGIVNWNAIPGGFQPLPQIAGRSKKLYQLSQFHGGINQKSSPRDIADFECVEATNLTVSQIGRIKLLGDIKGTDNSITTDTINETDRGSAGYGLFQFIAPAQADGTVGETVITLVPNGDIIDQVNTSGAGSFMSYTGADDHDMAHVIYAAGNGVYANSAYFRTSSDTPRKANIYVYREDQNGTVSGWVEGEPLIASPVADNEAGADAGQVNIEASDLAADEDGSMNVCIIPTGTGVWDGEYFFYVSWLFDGGVETGLTAIGTDTFTAATAGKLVLNPSLLHTTSAPLGADKRIEGARIYFKKTGTSERWLLAELSLAYGVKGALDSTFIPWTIGSNIHDLATHLIFDAPPEVYSYASLNGYYANEVYTKSVDLDEDDSGGGGTLITGPTAHVLRYKTAVVGSGGIVFIGNVKFEGKHMPDSMMFSMPNKPGLFPKYNRFDSPSSDGSPITALASFKDTILQFKQNAMYVINVSNPAQFYAQSIFRDCGVFNPCQVFTTSFGVIFANKNGCFIYDGSKVISLASGKFDFDTWDLTEVSSIANDAVGVPCVGYDPRSQNIIVLHDIAHDSTKKGAWIYNMTTQSWTEGTEMITNANGNRHTNFIITSGGYLSILRDDSTSLFNYKQGNNAQKIVYETKDLDFGLPSQTKKLFKVYITYKGNASNLTATWGYNGEPANARHFTATNWADDSDTDDYEIATLVPDDAAESKDWTSMAIYITSGANTVAADFEINDISILYRARPIAVSPSYK